MTHLPPLRSGDLLDRPTFHARYLAMPPEYRAELIEGLVIEPGPISGDHSDLSTLGAFWLASYSRSTVGTKANCGATVLLAPMSEPQPDVMLRVLPALGGQTRNIDGFIAGPPELVFEVAYTRESADLHGKRRDYERAGVREYVVATVHGRSLIWFAQQDGCFVQILPDDDGVYRSTTFPGLWLDGAAMLSLDGARVVATLKQALEDPRHAEFVIDLQRRVPSARPPPE